ncbi:DUF2586 family protein [Flavobacterium suncheonense]|uniref:DUF2586 family protein n=1 Tax=Flavobacterium suncheonense GH29-5 = DSM 17707 TaxID=1121899 RepID=A0A0A2ME86_9FLAO|nr:DUF2586 family protein [Flavobacterium suncheonense]KGO89738.1 hypothetical protein Q764_05975 [Flavobacterium suncheonense GH29-5 = DSM 17707]
MSLPGVNVQFENGNLGVVATNPDGVFGLVSSATAVASTFELNKHYVIKSLKDAENLGITNSVGNYELYKTIKEFYAEAGTGTELWIYGVAKTRTLDQLIDDSETLLNLSNRRIRAIILKYAPSVAETTTEDGLREDFPATLAAAQAMAEAFTVEKIHPVIFILEGYNFTGVAQDLTGFELTTYNRVAVMIGDTEKRSDAAGTKGAAVGVLAGRLAKNQVHVNVGRVKDGALKPLEFFIVNAPVEQYDVEALHDKGFITLRTHVGKSGYYFSDDPLACTVEDDYHYITRRRVIDKAYTLANATLTNFLLDQVPLTNEGKMQPSYAKALEAEVERVIAQEMTAKGEISADVTQANDTGVQCEIDLNEIIATTSKIKGRVRVRPHGYGRFIEFSIGYTINS